MFPDSLWLTFWLGFPGGSAGREPTCNAGDNSWIPGQEGPLKKGWATYSHSFALSWCLRWESNAIWETWVQSLGWEDPLEEGMVTHSSFLVWRISMHRGTWRATVHGLTELDMTE